MVADRVEVVSRKAGEDQAWRWTSDGKTGFDIEPAERAVAGTTVLLHFNEEGKQYANSWRLQEIVKKYSNHIAFPIFLTYDKSEWNEAEKKSIKTRTTEQVNAASALWRRPKSELKDEDYKELYKSITGDWEDPLFWFHTKAEGSLEYTTLFYVPVEGAARSLPGRVQGRRKALREARLHHGRRQGASAAVPALRSRHHRQRRPSAQRQPRNPAAESRAHQHPHRQRQEDSLRAEEHRGQPARTVSEVHHRVQPPAQGRSVRRLRQSRNAARSGSLQVHQGGRPHQPRRREVAHEGRAEEHLLHHRRRRIPAAHLAAARDLQEEGSRSSHPR